MAVDIATHAHETREPIDNRAEYPSLFRTYVRRGVETALADCRAGSPRLPDEVRERCLHMLSFALKLPGCWPQARDLLLALAPMMEIHGQRNEWREYLHKSSELAEATGDSGAVALIHLHLGRLSLIAGEHVLAEEQLDHALRVAEHNGDLYLAARIMERLAYCAAVRSSFVQARQIAQAALGLLPEGHHGCAPIHHTLGYVALLEARWQMAVEHFNIALATRKTEPIPLFEAQGLRDCGMALLSLGEYAAATAHTREAIRLFGLAGDQFNQATARMNLGLVYFAMQRCHESLECYELCEPVFVKTNSSVHLARLHHNRALALSGIGRPEEAIRSLFSSLRWAEKDEPCTETAHAPERIRRIYAPIGPGADVNAELRESLVALDKLPERPAYLHKEMVRKVNEVAALHELYRTAQAAA
jgi:tetratricopeptide (TPR) repeat protein